MKNSTLQSLNTQILTAQTLVIIDPQVDDWYFLLEGVKKNTKVVLLDREQNSIEQIDNLIKQHPNLESLHLISHGNPGSLELGSNILNSDTLESYRDRIKSWSEYLKGTSLLIYGCEVARGVKGKFLLKQLHDLTQANIAASTHKIGNSQKGGNWVLDYQIGAVELELAFVPEVLELYTGTFEPVISFSAFPNILIETEETLFTFRFELSEPPPEGGVVVEMLGDVAESLSQIDVFDIRIEGGNNLIPEFSNNGFFLNITEQVATVSSPFFLDDDTTDAQVNTPGFQDDNFVVTYRLEEGEGYTVDPENSTAGPIFFYDDPSQVPTQVVSLAADVTTLIEEEATETTLTLTLDEVIPTGGLVVNIGSGVADSLSDFESDFTVTGGEIVSNLDDNSGFSFRANEPTATITLPIFDDGDDPDTTATDDIGIETVTYSLLSNDDYEINSEFSAVTFTLADTRSQLDSPGLPVVSIAADVTTLIEAQATETTLTLTLNEAPPEAGLVVNIGSGSANSLNDFESDFTVTGGEIVENLDDDSGFSFRMDEATATITLPIFDDGDDPDTTATDDIGVERFTYSLLSDEDYNIDLEASTVSFTLADTQEALDNEIDLLETDIFRFQNTAIPGTYLYAGGEEAQNIRDNFPDFREEGLAFQVAVEPGDGLIALNRFQSLVTPGTYLYAGEEESQGIRDNFSEEFTEEGLAFYVYGAGANKATPFTRFQNSNLPGTYLFADPRETVGIEANFPGFLKEGIAFEADTGS